MRKLIVTEFMTLDGIMEAPDKWSLQYWNDDISKVKNDELMSSDIQLLGRVTYEAFASAWPTMEGTGDFGVKMNTMKKVVVSTTLTNPTWENTNVIKDNVVDEIKKLKEEEGGDILVAGSATLVETLTQNNLVDLYRFLVYPITLGEGKRMFRENAKAKLKLVTVKDMGSDVILLEYKNT